MENQQQRTNRSQFFNRPPKKGTHRKREGLQEECRVPSQYTETVSSQQKEQRTHRKQNPMPKIQPQPPPSQRVKHTQKMKL